MDDRYVGPDGRRRDQGHLGQTFRSFRADGFSTARVGERTLDFTSYPWSGKWLLQ